VTTRTNPPISWLTGEFLDPDLEGAFREETREEWLARLWLVSSVGAIFYLAGGVVDVVLIGPGARLAGTLSVRLAVAAALLGAPFAAQRTKAVDRTADRVVLAVMLLTAFATVWIVAASPGELLTHSLTVLVILLVFYLFVPVRTLHAVIAGVALAAAFVVEVVVTHHPGVAPGELALVVLYLGLVTVLGAVFRVHLHQARRREYLLLHAERTAARSALAEMEGRHRAESALAESESRYRALVELSPNAIVVHRNGFLLYANPVGAALIAAPDTESVIGRPVLEVIHPDYHQQVLERMEQVRQEARTLPSAEMVLVRLDGVELPCEVVSGPTTFGGEPAIQSVLRDVSERRRMENELRQLAITDPLTGACNRRHFFQHIEVEWERARRYRRPLSVLMVDVDRLKDLNDRHGHAAGDRALVTLVEICRQTLRSQDLLARMGGDEFAVILPETDLAEAHTVAERLLRYLVDTRSPGGDRPSFTVSVGVAQCDLEHGSPERCLQRADTALLAAKRNGRDTVAEG